jgi:hypothetical protein
MLYHYWTQPIVHPISWYWHHYIPRDLHIFSTFIHFLIELVIPYFLFFRFCYLRSLAGLGCAGLMTLITFTGCYGFFNLNNIVLCLSMIHDDLIQNTIHLILPSPSPLSLFQPIFFNIPDLGNGLLGFTGQLLFLQCQLFPLFVDVF